jgi:hypothetical protein
MCLRLSHALTATIERPNLVQIGVCVHAGVCM